MSGTTIIRYLLANAAGVTALVPATRIMAGVLPIDIERPCIAVQQISGEQANTLKMGESSYLVTHRIQVTMFATDTSSSSGYDAVRALLNSVLTACPHNSGVVNGITCYSITPDAEGYDDYNQDTLTYSLTQDFMVTFVR